MGLEYLSVALQTPRAELFSTLGFTKLSFSQKLSLEEGNMNMDNDTQPPLISTGLPHDQSHVTLEDAA